MLSCDGGGGEDQGDYTVYDVIMNLEVVGGNFTDCPESANMKLSLIINEDNITGFAELMDFGHIGEPIEVSGLNVGSSFSLNPFSVYVSGGLTQTDIPRPIYLDMRFAGLEGTFVKGDTEMFQPNIEGIVSGDISYSVTGGPDCIAQFTGEFLGIARTFENCVSSAEALKLECRAIGFVNQCNGDYLCGGCDEEICFDFIEFNVSLCQPIDCLTVFCPSTIIGFINLEGIDNYDSFKIPDNFISCSKH